MKAKKVYEFRQGVNPYEIMGLGYSGKVKAWFDTYRPGWKEGLEYKIKDNNVSTDSLYQFPEDEEFDSEMTTLPDGLIVIGTLDLANCISLANLPDDLNVGESLILKNCTNLGSLPNGLIVGRNLNVQCTSLNKLPDDLVVTRQIHVDQSQYNKWIDTAPIHLRQKLEIY
jgi:hypothetical protein